MSLTAEYHAVNNLSILKFSGVDASNFLQGQLSNDVNALSSTWQYSGYCNPKGRLLALLQLWRDTDGIYAAVDSSLVEATVKRLRMYVMRSNVVIEELRDAACVGLIDSNTQAERFSLDINDSIHTLHFTNRSLLIDLKGSLQGNNSADWAQASIAAGEPVIDVDNVELFVPQMVNLDLLDGINFKKGCYTGQEIVARMHYLGKLKQRMFVCELNGAATSGEKIMADMKSAGNIVSTSGNTALAVIRRELLKNQLTTESGATITPLSQQPYSIPE